MFRLSGVSSEIRPTFLENRHIYDLCLVFEEICSRIPALRKVDTYDPKVWKKYFDADGHPLILTNENDVESNIVRNTLRDFLRSDSVDIQPSSRPSRRRRKLENQANRDTLDEFKGLFS